MLHSLIWLIIACILIWIAIKITIKIIKIGIIVIAILFLIGMGSSIMKHIDHNKVTSNNTNSVVLMEHVSNLTK